MEILKDPLLTHFSDNELDESKLNMLLIHLTAFPSRSMCQNVEVIPVFVQIKVTLVFIFGFTLTSLAWKRLLKSKKSQNSSIFI